MRPAVRTWIRRLSVPSMAAGALALAVLAVAGLAPSARAQEDRGGDAVEHRCLHCDGRGLVACTNHKDKDLEQEEGAIACSVLAACEECGGLLELPCPVCRDPKATKIWRKRHDALQGWIEGLRRQEEEWGVAPMVHGRSAHFELSWGLASLKVGNRRLNAHEGMHLTLRRLEAVWAYFDEIFHVRPADFTARHQVLVFPEEAKEAFYNASRALIGRSGGNNNGFKLLGKPSIFTVLQDRKNTATDKDLHRFLVHNVCHLLLANYANSAFWFGEHKLGWFDEGLASHFEVHFFGFSDNRCHQEVDASQDWNSERWKKRARKLVITREAPSFLEISQRNIDEIGTEDRALAWLYIEFLLQRDPKGFAELVRTLKSKVPLRDALPRTMGLTTIGFDDAFRDYARTNFPMR